MRVASIGGMGPFINMLGLGSNSSPNSSPSLGLGSNLSPSSRPIWASPKRICITNLGLGSNLHLWASLKGSKLPHSPPLQPDPSFNPIPWRPSYVDGCKILSHGFRCEAAIIQTYIFKNFNDNNFKY